MPLSRWSAGRARARGRHARDRASRSAASPSGAGCRRTRSSRGSTARGSSRATRASPSKAGPILDLYAGRWQGELLHPGDYVVCADEKPSIQARQRKHADAARRAAARRGQRVEHEYERMGALCYLAAWDARRAKLFDRCAPKDGIDPFDALVEQFMSSRALQQRAARVRDRRQRLRAPRPTLDRPPPRRLAEPDRSSTPRSTPAGSTRPRSTSPSSSARSSPPTTSPTSTRSSNSLLAFGRRYEQIAAPFEWKFTRARPRPAARPATRRAPAAHAA